MSMLIDSNIIIYALNSDSVKSNPAQSFLTENALTLIFAQQNTFELIKKYNVSGTEIFDAYLVATALSNNILTIVTDNVKYLSKYKEITVLNPFQ